MSTVKHFTFPSPIDSLTLDAMEFIPEGKIRGIVQLVHGMCEYKERYTAFCEFLADHGYLAVIHDHRGHGKSIRSMDDLGYFYEGGYEGLIEDIHELTSRTKVRHPEKVPYILLGHSMGSLAVRCYIKKYDYEIDQLLVVGSPSDLPAAKPGLAIVKMLAKTKGGHAHSKFVDNLCNGNYEKRYADEHTIHAWVCSDKAVLEKYNKDPFCNYTFTLNGYVALVTTQVNCYDKKNWGMKNPDLPIFFFSGEGDPCAVSREDFYRSVQFLRDRGYKNVSAKLYPDMRHEVLNEIGKEQVYEDMLKFIEGD